MPRRKLQPGFVMVGISCFFSVVFWLVGMPWPFFLTAVTFLAAFTWFAFDAAGLPPSELKRRALIRSAVVFFAVALCDLVLAAVGPRHFAVTPFISFSLLPIGQGIAILWQRSRLSAAHAAQGSFLAHPKT
jgi:membrane protein required for beta-lactamase induction